MRRLFPLLLLLALLASCGGPAGPVPQPTGVAPQPGATPDSPEGVTISFAVWDYERPIYEPLVERFMAEHPGITVVLVPLDDIMNVPSQGPESSTAMLRRLVSAADTAPAVGIPSEALGSALLLDLKPLMDADARFTREDFYPGALERWTVNSGTWALPRYFYLQVLSYNRDLFKLANIPEPQPGWTWEELLATAEQVSAAGGGGLDGQTYGYLDNSGGFQPLIAMLKPQGLDLLSTPASELRLDDQRIFDAIERIRQLYKDGVLYQPYSSDPNVPPQDPAETVRQGRVAIWGDVYIPGPDGNPVPPEGIDVGQIPYPADTPDPWGGLGGEGYIISGGTAHPNEAWTWIEWLSRQEIGQPGGGGPANMPGRIPARRQLAEQTGFWDSISEQAASAYRWALEHPAPLPTRQPDHLTLGAVSQAVSQAVSSPSGDTRQALAEAQKWLDETFAQQNLTPTPEPDLSPVLVATPEPQTAPEGATTITFAVPGYSPSEIRRVARAFREQRPDIFVQIKATEFFTGPLQLADVARTADCFTWGQAPQSEADFAALLDLQPLIDADGSFPKDDYPPAVLAAYQRGGSTYGLPYAFNLRTLNYNRTAFDAAGIPVPDGSWDAQDFLAAAQALTTGEGDARQYGYVALNGVQNDLLFFIGQFGGRLTTGAGQDLRPSYTDQKTVAAIRWYIDLYKTHGVMPPIRLYYKRDDPGFEDRSFEYVQTGRAGMWFDMGYGMFSKEGGFAVAEPAIAGGGPGIPMPVEPGQPDRPFEVGISPLPVGSGGLRSGDFYARGMHIAAGTQNAQACWEWLKFLSTDITSVYGDFPARISVAQGETFGQQAPPERMEIYRAYAEVLRRPSTPGDDPAVLYSGQLDPYWLWKAIMATVEEDADLAVGLEEAQRLTTAYAECVAGGEKPPACALKVDPEYQGFNVEDPGMPGGPKG
ncbi:MAG TPA: extracellular solute-binding protein [Roseiflexaceae bacterium]|nr:extracellular solute-binding protein [Roseiflexaceae bacterium]